MPSRSRARVDGSETGQQLTINDIDIGKAGTRVLGGLLMCPSPLLHFPFLYSPPSFVISASFTIRRSLSVICRVRKTSLGESTASLSVLVTSPRKVRGSRGWAAPALGVA